MNRLLPFIFASSALISFEANSQCAPATASAELNVNNVKTTILNGGDMWWDLQGSAKYEVPKGSGVNALFAGSIWIGGLTSTSELKLAAQQYRSKGNDFYPGPLDQNGNLIGSNCMLWDRVFQVSKEEIQDFKDFSVLSSNVRDWPAKGNANISAPMQDLAPTIDVDMDGVYDPSKGDYPDIKGDQAVWWVFNDVGNLHTESGGGQIGIEVQVMAYAFATNNQLNNATFYDYTLIKKSQGFLHNSYVGFFVDGDLGNPNDDFAASHRTKRMGIVYNGDPIDENSGFSTGYGLNPPAIAYQIIKTPNDATGNPAELSSVMTPYNGTSPTSDPNNASEYYNYMKGVWRDGTPATMGGNGYDRSNGTLYPFMYDLSIDCLNWTECEANNSAHDRRLLLSVGPLNMEQNISMKFTNAVLWTRDTAAIDCGNLDFVTGAVDSMNVQLEQELNKAPLSSNELVSDAPKIFPNPASDKVFVELNSTDDFKNVELYDLQARLVSPEIVAVDDHSFMLNTRNLKDGIYFLSLNYSDRRSISKLIVKH